MNSLSESGFATIPMKWVGPLLLVGPEIEGEISAPLATYETPLWPSTQRGIRVANAAGGLKTVIADERMSRSVLVEAPSAEQAVRVVQALPARREELEAAASAGSRYARLIDWHTQVVGNLLYLRIEMSTGDAAGHNMVTAAADRVLDWLLSSFPELRYVSVSGNFCTDKKVSAVNGILGRGKYVIVEAVIPRAVCDRFLKTTPEAIANLNLKKNWMGTQLAGGVRSANAHFANILLAFYLATGQDAANIVEGSQGFTHAEVRDGDLYFSVTLPNVIVGTVGNGKGLDFVKDNLTRMGCLESREPGVNARRLAAIVGALTWCGELSLLAAQTRRGELMRAHVMLERS